MLFNSFFEYEQQPFEGEFDDCLYLEYAILLYRPAMRAHKRVTGSFILGANFLSCRSIFHPGCSSGHARRFWRAIRMCSSMARTIYFTC